MICLLLFIFIYVYNSLCLYRIANKVGEQNAWYAWVPIANIFLLCEMGEQSGLYVLACFIPYVGELVILYLMLNLPNALGVEDASKYLILIPGVNTIYMGYLAFRTEPYLSKTSPRY